MTELKTKIEGILRELDKPLTNHLRVKLDPTKNVLISRNGNDLTHADLKALFEMAFPSEDV